MNGEQCHWIYPHGEGFPDHDYLCCSKPVGHPGPHATAYERPNTSHPSDPKKWREGLLPETRRAIDAALLLGIATKREEKEGKP